MKQKEQIRRIDKVPSATKKEITKLIESTIKKFGIDESRLVMMHYFTTYKQTLKRKEQIAALQKEIISLSKKK